MLNTFIWFYSESLILGPTWDPKRMGSFCILYTCCLLILLKICDNLYLIVNIDIICCLMWVLHKFTVTFWSPRYFVLHVFVTMFPSLKSQCTGNEKSSDLISVFYCALTAYFGHIVHHHLASRNIGSKTDFTVFSLLEFYTSLILNRIVALPEFRRLHKYQEFAWRWQRIFSNFPVWKHDMGHLGKAFPEIWKKWRLIEI